MENRYEVLLNKILCEIENIDPNIKSSDFQIAGYTRNDIDRILEIAYDEKFIKGEEVQSKDWKFWRDMRLTMKGKNHVEKYREQIQKAILRATNKDDIGISPYYKNGGIAGLLTISNRKEFKGKMYVDTFNDLVDMEKLENVKDNIYRITLKGKEFLRKNTLKSKLEEREEDSMPDKKKAFIIHGHDEGTRETVARFVEKLKLESVILHEKPNQGRTIIQKFEDYSDVGYAIVLLTPDDVGNEKNKQKKLNPRARQNVIFEFGYFIGKLGGDKVCGIIKGDVEIPSDYSGVLYIKLDQEGNWRTKLFRELKTRWPDIDANLAF